MKKFCCSWYLRNHISHDCHLWYTCVKWWYIQWIFSFFQKAKKMTQNNNKNLCHFVSQELYFIWLWFAVHVCKMMISPAIFFHFFKILICQVFQSSSINAKRKLWGVIFCTIMNVVKHKEFGGVIQKPENSISYDKFFWGAQCLSACLIQLPYCLIVVFYLI